MKAAPLVLLAAGAVLAAWLSWQMAVPAPAEPAVVTAAPAAAQAPPTASAVAAAASTPPQHMPPTASASSGDIHAWFADFQAAQGSRDLAVVERGLDAWHRCASFHTLGLSDLESRLRGSIPAGLPREEWERRAEHVRRAARGCEGFAMQADTMDHEMAMHMQAVELGSLPERLREDLAAGTIPGAAAPAGVPAHTACALLTRHAQTPIDLGVTTPVMSHAAAARPSHLLNAYAVASRNVGINLAMCDLYPPRCDQSSQRLVNSCIDSGACDHATASAATGTAFARGSCRPCAAEPVPNCLKERGA